MVGSPSFADNGGRRPVVRADTVSRKCGCAMDPQLQASEFDGRHWPTYRPRRIVAARRLGRPTVVDGHYWRDGYLVRDVHGHVMVVGVAEFEAVYELAGRFD